ncbi:MULTISPECIES: OmpA family protein [unclassified Pseudomonas]|uniref:OmpA family protein n=1 Tax=unclassified Pseudomonas TaxID=196821 RepID=UPI000BC90F63|nr:MULTISPECIES: OmpA family protein [unclassified Pseudomonas]PVZ20090.1 outer membrane protein OmpA-like peptidoglycan-associated protein [Pseudomonas sp. URIL14HWK12:I12]PVZ27156.1 outer membrane protein OmpA-like peptidoglycan-associated protein [Pseudomonas sp. URIL14HWK12:I10]PVZ38045.1 outer membrane protein OmpA-like peptidoglycan-associated protein [Pseudomonas sp. URIL14HWK12:I11]SNZ04724.1 Outer membrane protein OmpA [Pseudomonas sp. URIL14HWK12:I9]
MHVKKSLALALCLAITGCANTPDAKNGSASAGHSWWPFGGNESTAAADKGAGKDVQAAVNDRVAKADVKAAAPAATTSESHWWWPFGDSAKAEEAKPAAVAAVPKVDPAATKAFLDKYEPKVRDAVKGTKFQVERRDDLLVVTAPVDSSFNPDRPSMLMPVVLGPITNVAKLLEPDPQGAVLILGHADSTGAADVNKKLSLERAQSVAAIFRLSGLERTRLSLRGMGSVMPRAANDSVAGRALNRRVEMIVTPQNTMLALMARYDLPPTSLPQMVAMQDVKAEPEAPAKPAVAAKKAPAKKAPAKVAAAKKSTASSAAKKPAAKKPAANQQASN